MNIEPLIYWVEQRDKILAAKKAGKPPPYTDDPILAKFRFCNVRRRDDRVSQWLLKHVLTAENLHAAGESSFIMFTALCRWINWPPTIQAIMEAGLWPKKRPNWYKIIKLLEKPTNGTKRKIWTGAYMITARGALPGQSKGEFIVDTVLRLGLGMVLPEVKAALKTDSKKAVWEVLTTRNNWGAFMSGQVVDDWTWTPLLWGVTDNFSWAPQGPGSIRGLNRLLGLPLKTRHKETEWCENLVQLRRAVIERLGNKYRSMTLHDTQNCMCEIDKYLRTKNGEGKPRSIYKPEVAY